jgi:ribonuclease Z
MLGSLLVTWGHMLDVCLLGTGGMQPLPGRRLSATLVRFGGRLVLIDCGEGTQVAVRERGWGWRNLSAILLTHLHADHVLGLPGLLLTLAHSEKGADEPLTIFGPEPLVPVLEHLLILARRLPFPVQLVTLAGGETTTIPETDGLALACLPLDHEIPCLAYALSVPRAPRFDPERASALGVPQVAWRRLQRGEVVEVDGRAIQPGEVLGPPRRGLRLVLATDTRPTPALPGFVRGDGGAGEGEGADLFIADAMYGDEEDKPKRWEAQHMTFAEAATIARDGGARQLWLTHFSPTLSDPDAYLDRATAIFPATTLGHDGLTTTLAFDEA